MDGLAPAGELGNHPVRVQRVAYSPDSGRMLATATDTDEDVIRLWDTTTGNLIAQARANSSQHGQLAFSPGNPVLAAGAGDWTATLWRLDPADAVRRLCTMLAPSSAAEEKAHARTVPLAGPRLHRPASRRVARWPSAPASSTPRPSPGRCSPARRCCHSTPAGRTPSTPRGTHRAAPPRTPRPRRSPPHPPAHASHRFRYPAKVCRLASDSGCGRAETSNQPISRHLPGSRISGVPPTCRAR